jgi:hypothetical protein
VPHFVCASECCDAADVVFASARQKNQEISVKVAVIYSAFFEFLMDNFLILKYVCAVLNLI